MSVGAVVHEERVRREEAQAHRRREVAEEGRRSRKAIALLREHAPDLHDGRPGHPCPWAIWAVLRLWRHHGALSNVTVAAVRRERTRLLDRRTKQWGHAPYDQEVDHQ